MHTDELSVGFLDNFNYAASTAYHIFLIVFRIYANYSIWI